MSNSIMQGIVFALYIGIMLGVGFLFYKKSESHADYILGGRGMNKWVTAKQRSNLGQVAYFLFYTCYF